MLSIWVTNSLRVIPSEIASIESRFFSSTSTYTVKRVERDFKDFLEVGLLIVHMVYLQSTLRASSVFVNWSTSEPVDGILFKKPYGVSLMNLEARQKLAEIINNLIEKHGSARNLAKKIGVSHSTISGWQKMTSIPDPENLKGIAKESGFTVYELQEILDSPKTSAIAPSVDRVIYEIQQLSSKDIARVIEAAARYLSKNELVTD